VSSRRLCRRGLVCGRKPSVRFEPNSDVSHRPERRQEPCGGYNWIGNGDDWNALDSNPSLV